MVLVDKQIKELVDTKGIIFNTYHPERVHAVHYDINIAGICVYHGKKMHLKNIHLLFPGETAFVKADANIAVPEDYIVRVIEKNRVIRYGLAVSGPMYQSGYKGGIYLRVRNVSNKPINVTNGKSVAALVFEKLVVVPDELYAVKGNNDDSGEQED